jgi:hypothetical protein
VTTTPHPDQVLGALKQKTKRSDKVRSLDVIHSVCGEIHASGGVNYTYALVGRMSERQGGPACITLYSKASEDYRTLINAWEAHAKAQGRSRPVKPQLATDDHLLQQISDPSIRMLLSMAIAERYNLRKQLDTLRSQTNITVDLRPLPGVATVDTKANEIIQVVTPLEGLSPTQRDSLQRAIAPATLKSMGWVETLDGEVVVQRTGEVIYGPGYTHAINFLLTAPNPANASKRTPKTGPADSTDAVGRK